MKPAPPASKTSPELQAETVIIALILAVVLGLLSVGVIYFVLMELNVVGVEPPAAVHAVLLVAIPAFVGVYFVVIRRWLAGSDSST